MNLKKSIFGRAGAAIAALTLATVGAATAASATTEDPGPSYPTPTETTGTLTVHKHENEEVAANEPSDGSEQDVSGAPIAGVEFSVQQVGKKVDNVCSPLNLSEPAGWADVKAVSEADAVSDPYCLIGQATTAVTDEDGMVTFNLPVGLYYVTEGNAPADTIIKSKALPFFVTVPMPANDVDAPWNYAVHAYPKNVVSETSLPVKTLENGDALAPGDTMKWMIEATVPANANGYKTVTITDIVAGDHGPATIVTVEINGVEAALGTDYTVDNGVITFLTINEKVAAGEDANIVVHATTVVPARPTGPLSNKATLTLNTTDLESETPASVWGQVTANKVDEENAPLDGAEFAVYAGKCVDVSEGTAPLATGTTVDGSWIETLYLGEVENADQTVSKDFCLMETAAPAGYILDPNAEFDFNLNSIGDGEFTAEFTVENVKVEGPDLPLTGAQGTALLTGLGFLLLAGGAGTVYASRRRNA